MYSITVEQISKKYGEITALSNINLSVAKGEIFGLIGPDGAGKTTLLRILTTLISPDSGSANVDGFDIVQDYKRIRQTVGYMPGKFSLYPDLTVEENINLFAGIFGTTVSENYHLVKDIYSQIEPFKNRQAGKLSGGMKQKLALSCALIHKPNVLFLDEPTTGVDPVSRSELWEMLKKLKSQGITVFVSTAYMDEANQCDRVALIDKGSLLSVEAVSEIVAGFKQTILSVKGSDKYQLINALKLYENTNKVYPFGESVHISLKRNEESTILKNYLMTKNMNNISVDIIEPDIEDCFIHLMGNDE